MLTEKFGSEASSRSEAADLNARRWGEDFDRAATLEFNRDRKSMGILVRSTKSSSSPTKLLVKGAPSSVIERCTHAKLPSGKVRQDEDRSDELRASPLTSYPSS